MATGMALQIGTSCFGVSCASSSSQNRSVSGSGASHQSFSLPSLKVDGVGMKFRERPGWLRWREEMKVAISPVVGAAMPSRFDAFEEPSASGLMLSLFNFAFYGIELVNWGCSEFLGCIFLNVSFLLYGCRWRHFSWQWMVGVSYDY